MSLFLRIAIFVAVVRLGSGCDPAFAQPTTDPCPVVGGEGTPRDAASIFFLSSREASCVHGKVAYTKKRARTLSFGEASVRSASSTLALESWDDWRKALDDRLNSAPTHRLLIYVHGYKNDVEQPLRRARALRIASGFDGPIVVLLWPSQSNLGAYIVDETNAEWTTYYFRWLLDALPQSASFLTVVSHSMGNRIALNGIREFIARNPAQTAKFDHLILASADVDRGQLARDLVMDFGPIDLTVYASSNDMPLSISSGVHGYPRAGYLGRRHGSETPDVFPIESRTAKLVDTSNVRHKGLGHADFIETAEGAADLCRVISGGDLGLGRTVTPLPQTWQLVRTPHATDPCAQQGKDAAASH